MAPVEIKLGGPRWRSKIAMFDFDWTLVKPKSGGTFPIDVDDWEYLAENVPLKVQECYKKGYAVYVVTNQSKLWKHDQIKNVMNTIGVPCTIIIATKKEEYKPNKKLILENVGDKKWKREESFFVGDALGRPTDFADSDKLFAENIGVRIYSPEDFFNIQKAVAVPMSHQEVIIMTGYPGSGKSTIAKEVFGKAGYEVLDGDVHKTSAKMIRVAERILMTDEKASLVFDATNPTAEKRGEFIAFAKQHGLPVRCVYVSTSMEEAMRRNEKREESKRVPKIAYYVYRKKFEKPTEVEGCEVIIV